MREALATEALSEQPQANLRGLDGIGAAFNAVLAERGLSLVVTKLEFGLKVTGPEWLGDIARYSDEPPIVAEPEGPPPGGCYCTDCDEQGRCWSYCC